MLSYTGAQQSSCTPRGKLAGRTDPAENASPLPARLALAGQPPLRAPGGGTRVLAQGSG